jgi:hypothetical protein
MMPSTAAASSNVCRISMIGLLSCNPFGTGLRAARACVELTPIPNIVQLAAIMRSQTGDGGYMGILRAIGIVLIVVWLVLWLFVKITIVAIHLLLLLGIATIVIDLARSKSKGSS